ncbi:MAG TPA: helix-turn-helix transcriptional regulator [Candidatus Acidoferrales bacterium]
MGHALGEFEQIILLALVRLGPDAYGVTILREIELRTGRRVAIGAVYTSLARLEKKGYVAHHVGPPTPERGGRRKKFYQLEPAGARALSQSFEALTAMIEDASPSPATGGIRRK